jgi:hypothetical protein
VNSEKSTSGNIAWGTWIAIVAGVLLFLLGAGRFARGHHFGFMEGLYCCLAVIPAGLLLLVFDYVLHHAKLVSILVLLMAGSLVASFPAFDVGLGLALVVAIAGPALREWKDEKRLRESAAPGGENKESE